MERVAERGRRNESGLGQGRERRRGGGGGEKKCRGGKLSEGIKKRERNENRPESRERERERARAREGDKPVLRLVLDATNH